MLEVEMFGGSRKVKKWRYYAQLRIQIPEVTYFLDVRKENGFVQNLFWYSGGNCPFNAVF